VRFFTAGGDVGLQFKRAKLVAQAAEVMPKRKKSRARDPLE